MALNDLVQIAGQHVVVTTTDVPEVTTFEERSRSKERGTTVAVSESLSLRNSVSKERGRPNDAFRRARIDGADFAQAAEEGRSLVERERAWDPVVRVEAAVEVGELFDAGDER